MDTNLLADNWHERVKLDQLVPYTHPSAAWSDRHSGIAVFWTRETETGLQSLQSMIGWGGNKITDTLLKWSLTEEGRELPLTLKSRNYRPDKIIEVDAAAEMTITAIASYPVKDAIAVELELENHANRTRTLQLSFQYPGQGVKPDWEGPFPAGHIVSVEHEPEGSWSTLFVHHEHGRQVTWVEAYVSGLTEGTTLELVCIADLSARAIRLDALGKQKVVVALGFGSNRGSAKLAYKDSMERVQAGWDSAAETRRWRAIFASAAPLPAKYAGNEQYERMYAHAIAGLNTLFIQGNGGYTGNKCVPWTTKDLLAIAFFWDTAFSCMGAKEFNPFLCQEAIECFADNASPRGGMPGTLSDTHRAGEGQAPVMATAAWQVFRKTNDIAWLEKVYPAFCGYVRFWYKHHSSARGVAQYYNAGQVGDNDVRFDPVYGRKQGNEPLAGFESPDLSAFFVVEMRCLASMAEQLGYPEERRMWTAEADALGQSIVELFYFPEESMFFDVKEGTRQIFSGAKGPNMFLPLWAGVPLAEEECKRIIENHMLNPDEFFRENPFPSVSFDHPEYDPNGYWRGRIWPHIAFLMAQTLWKYGYHREAELTADRLIRLFNRTPWFHENYESLGSTGIGYTEEGFPIGFPEYNWSNATVILLLLEKYKDDAYLGH